MNRGHGGRRVGAGRPRVNENAACHRVIQQRAQLIEDFMKTRGMQDDYKALRLLFVRKTREKVGSKAADLVENYAEDEQTATDALRCLQNRPTPLNDEDALQMLLRVDLSKHQYETLRKVINDAANFKNLIPSYKRVRIHKRVCQPEIPKEAFTESKAEVSMKNLLTHTTTRAVLSNKKNIVKALKRRRGTIDCEFTITYGSDGASGFTEFQQLHEITENRGNTDENLFAAMINPIVLKTANGVILWENTNPQSHSHVRPILLEYQKESKDYVLRVMADIDGQIEALLPVEVDLGNGKKLRIKFRMICSLIDGKIFCFLMNKPTTSCPVCSADFRQLKEYSRHVNSPIFDPIVLALLHGLQVLHAWINFGNHLFHLAWKIASLEAKRAAKAANPAISASELGRIGKDAWRRRDQEIIEEFRRHDIHLGKTLTGNMSRLLFGKKCDLTVQILGLDRRIIEKFRVILICINTTRFYLKPAKFKAFCEETRNLYLELYSFFPLTPTIHKILEHSTDSQRAIGLPLGVVSEGAAEATHRIRKLIRRFRARKMSRQKNLMDVFNRCCHLSDPVLSAKYAKCTEKFRNARRKRDDMQLPAAAIALLKPTIDGNDDDDEPPRSSRPSLVQNTTEPLGDISNRQGNLTREDLDEDMESEGDGRINDAEDSSEPSETEMESTEDELSDYEDVFADE